MNDISDDELVERFSSLRNNDAHSEPEFGALLDRSRSHQQVRSRGVAPAARWVTAAATIVIAAALLFGRRRESGNRATTAAPMGDWQSPTVGLLETHVQGLIAPPPLLSSVLDGVVHPTLPQTTD
jgi:hypothetical protein